jgi:hypothetical protein
MGVRLTISTSADQIFTLRLPPPSDEERDSDLGSHPTSVEERDSGERLMLLELRAQIRKSAPPRLSGRRRHHCREWPPSTSIGMLARVRRDLHSLNGVLPGQLSRHGGVDQFPHGGMLCRREVVPIGSGLRSRKPISRSSPRCCQGSESERFKMRPSHGRAVDRAA